MKFKKILAFTLAEVLITLGIIGVVAAMSIPVLLQENQKQQYVTSLKKFYTNFNQVLLQMAVKNGTPNDISDYFTLNSTEWLTEITNNLKIAKDCGWSSDDATTAECFAKFNKYHNSGSISTSDWTNYINVNTRYKLVTVDGMSLSLYPYGTGCTSNRSFTDTAPTYKSCGVVYVDTNGPKLPNRQGIDVFVFYITSNKTPMLYPQGGFYAGSGDETTGGANWWNYNNNNRCSATTNNDGTYCTGRLIQNNWVMDY